MYKKWKLKLFYTNGNSDIHSFPNKIWQKSSGLTSTRSVGKIVAKYRVVTADGIHAKAFTQKEQCPTDF
ncbi:MAG: hypothetical protein K6E73_02185 [Bacteroidales bacterium]|nr:hypothetical protein [Bacteroidales bacterium]